MGRVHEEIMLDPEMGVEIEVVQKDSIERGIIYINISSMRLFTPSELIKIGKWMQKQGERIKKDYTRTGRPKKSTVH